MLKSKRAYFPLSSSFKVCPFLLTEKVAKLGLNMEDYNL